MLSTFVEVAITFGQSYLACGGPTSRLEQRLVRAGHAFGFQCEVFAIPTGIFVSVSHKDYIVPVTQHARVKEFSYNLFSLYRLEKLLASMVNGKIRLSHAQRYLLDRHYIRKDYPKWVGATSPIIFGSFVTLPLTDKPWLALVGGLITFLVAALRKALVTHMRLNQAFSDFFVSWMAFAFSTSAAYLLKAPPEVLVFGSLIMMVPGLMLTTSVSELAEHNYISGVTKLVQGGLTLLAMGLAYLLFQEIHASVGAGKFAISGLNLGTGWSAPFWINVACLIAAVSSFSITINVPPKSLPLASAIGLCGLVAIKLFHESSFFIFGIFTASFIVGALSLLFGRWFKLPSQVYSVPGIVALVPGLMSLTLFNHVAFEKLDQVPPVMMQVVLTTTTIVFGLLAARVPFNLFSSEEERLAELEEGIWSQ